MLTRNELSFVERTCARHADDVLLRRNMHVVVPRALHARPQRPVVAFYEIDRAAQKIASAPLLRKPIHLIEKPRCQRVAHENVVTYPGKKV